MSNFNIGKEEIPPGTIIDNRYRIQTILGQGGLGRTYLAFDVHRFSEPCVLKEFAPLGSGQYDLEKSRDLFKREAKILHCITHPQIPKFLACFESHERLFLVQEFVNGKTYSALLKNRQQNQQAFSEREVIKLLIDVLPILDYIHKRGIIHRDISPDNIMQPEEEQLPVLIDFGVGKLTNTNTSKDSSKFGTGNNSYVGKMSFVGKIGYAPIEQISMGRCSPSSDLYSLGVTALVLLTGKDPTSLLNQDSLEWQWQKYVQVSPGFVQFIAKMTEARPLKRYQSAKEALKDLEKYFADIDTLIQNTGRGAMTVSSSEPQFVTAKGTQRKTKAYHNISDSQSSHPTPPLNSQAKLFEETQHPTSNQDQISSFPTKQDTSESMLDNDDGEDTVIVSLGSSNSDASTLDQEPNQTAFDNTMIVGPTHTDSSGIQSPRFPQESQQTTQSLNPDFINLCRQELAYFIGPMASLIIEEILAQKNFSAPESFIEAIAQQIPSMELRIKFKRRLI